MTRYHYNLVDVFTDRAFGGKPLAGFTEPPGLSPETMQAIAKELNLSESTFVLPLDPGAIDTRLPIEVVSCGVPFLFIPITDLKSIKSIRLRPDAWEQVRNEAGVGEIFVFTREVENEGSTVHSRMFAPAFGVPE